MDFGLPSRVILKLLRGADLHRRTEAPEGGYDARALGHSVFTQGDDWDDLKDMVRDAVLCHFDDRETPRVIRLHFVREEAIAASPKQFGAGGRPCATTARRPAM